MLSGAVLGAALAATATAPSASVTEAGLSLLSERLPQVASGFCVDILSRKVPLPAVDGEPALFKGYGLSVGLPPQAMSALGRDVGIVAQATLASGDAKDGSFMVALGGRAGETCRIVVYRAPLDGLFVQTTYEAMQRPAHGWRSLPVAVQPPGALKLSLLKRDDARRAYLANILAPTAPGPIAAVVVVAAVPDNVTVPEGY